ncbi:MAG TPA: ABC transporter permease subunit [Aestuariivirgaceae bacterium]|nr:ABC transporter permease subunit [Aestuariivirgaceae bacterium]
MTEVARQTPAAAGEALRPAPVAAARPGRFRTWLDRRAWRDLIIAIPYVWLLIFFLVPFFIVVIIAGGTAVVGIPPVAWEAEFPYLTFDNFVFLTEDNLYWMGYVNSVRIAAVSTLICLVVGYPMALGIARSEGIWRHVMLLMVILPFWTSFLLRIYAWMGMLGNRGIINNFLINYGFIDEPIAMMNTDFAVYVGIVYSYLPFMVLPLYANLEKLDYTLNEAAMDLGSRPWEVFRDITLPLSIPGIIAGAMLVFIPATGEYVIPTLLGSADSPMIGRVLADEFFLNRDWPVAAAVAVALLLLLVVPIMIYSHIESKTAQRG